MSRKSRNLRRYKDLFIPSSSHEMNQNPQIGPSQPAQPPQASTFVFQEASNVRRPIFDRLGLRNYVSPWSSDLRDHLNKKRWKEIPTVDLEVERHRKEVEDIKRNQKLTRKWVQLRNEFRETRQDFPPPSFIQGPNLVRSSDTWANGLKDGPQP